MEQLKKSIATFRSFSGPSCQNGKWNLLNGFFYFLMANMRNKRVQKVTSFGLSLGRDREHTHPPTAAEGL
jgi:hypothetical protein